MKTIRQQRNTERLEKELTSLERNLLRTLQERLGRIQVSTANKPAEFMDLVSDSELDELTARILESDSSKIDEIEEALQKLRDGDYGQCSDCGRNISKKRLQARPFATHCIECKQEAEKRHHANVGGPHRARAHSITVDLGDGEDTSTEYDRQETVRGNRL